MSTRYLLVSDPPHGDVDGAEAAPHFGLAVAEVRMKANYGLPEIWFAEESEAELADTATALEAAGLSIAVVSGSDLVEVPAQTPAESFAFTDDGLRLEREGAECMIAYDAPATAVVCRPRIEVGDAKTPAKPVGSRLSSWSHVGGAGRRSPDAGEGEFETPPFVDFYVRLDDVLTRISVVQGVTSFPPVPTNSPHGLSGMRNLVANCEERFDAAYFDHRLVDMRLRRTAGVVTVAKAAPARTGFSFATEALSGLLGSLSPDLKDISQVDLSSRLAYLTNRSRVAAKV